MYWIGMIIVMILHLMYGAFLLKLWQDRHIWSKEYLEHLEDRADAYYSEQRWK